MLDIEESGKQKNYSRLNILQMKLDSLNQTKDELIKEQLQDIEDEKKYEEEKAAQHLIAKQEHDTKVKIESKKAAAVGKGSKRSAAATQKTDPSLL